MPDASAERGAREAPIEVAIVGGGCAGVATAFELTRARHRGRYRVTLYQSGWRLGGKGASGRGPNDRIEEHGIHLWYGCYENAFRLMRECYAELKRDPETERFHDWRHAFHPCREIAMVDPGNSKAGPWVAGFEPTEGLPGDPIDVDWHFSVGHYLKRSADLLVTVLRSVRERREPGATVSGLGQDWADPLSVLTDLTRYGRLASLDILCRATFCLRQILGATPTVVHAVPVGILGWFQDQVGRQLEALVVHDDELRRLWEVADLLLAFQRGVIRWQLLTDARGFDAIEHLDLRDWLRDSGAAERALGSSFLRGLYDICFAYEDADPRRPRLAAGQGLRTVCRLFFTYRGPFYWRMNAGMGDVVFAPYYQVLRRRGVRFAFFHRLEEIELSSTGHESHVRALRFDVQAETIGGAPYEPLIDVRGLPCWPNAPRWGQLVGGARLAHAGCDFESPNDPTIAGSKTLRVGTDFDCVVLAVGLGAVPHVARQILERDRPWRTMVEQMGTVATQAFQLWLDVEGSDLGWRGPPGNIAGFVEPFNTWTDMSHLAGEESWPDMPRSIAYFCSMLSSIEGDDPAEQRAAVARAAVRFLDRDIRRLWPDAVGPDGRFRWSMVKGADQQQGPERHGPERFASQYWTANVHPSDRYVQSLPGSARYRISPLDRSLDNLTVAGDWTQCGFNAGTVESAVMSGRLAAHAISGWPLLDDIVGFDHP